MPESKRMQRALVLGALGIGVIVGALGAAALLTKDTKSTNEPTAPAETVLARSGPSPTTATQDPVAEAQPSPQGSAPSSDGLGFVESFDGGVGFDRFDYGIYHRGDLDDGTITWPEAAMTWSGDHDLNCGTPDTQRTIHRDEVSESFFLCRDHLMTSIGDTDGYSTGWFSPRQTFTSETAVTWDVNVTDLGSRQWWEMSIIPESFESGVPACPHCSVISWLSPSPSGLPAYPAGSVVVGNTSRGFNVSTDGVDRKVQEFYEICMLDPEGCASKSIRRPFSVIDNQDGTLTVEFGGFVTYTVPGSFPTDGFRVVFKDHNYTPDKDGLPVGYTWHWDSIVIR